MHTVYAPNDLQRIADKDVQNVLVTLHLVKI